VSRMCLVTLVTLVTLSLQVTTVSPLKMGPSSVRQRLVELVTLLTLAVATLSG
jgi:hypothetical protein